MVNTTKKLIEEIHEVKELAIKELGSDIFNDMNGKEFELLKRIFNIVNTSEEVMLKQANLLETINYKLDRLLEQAEES